MYFNKGYVRQIFIGSIISLSGLGFGFGFSWIGATETHLTSNRSPVGPITKNQVSWLGCLPPLGAIFGALIWSSVIERFGRKMTAVLIMVPLIISPLILFFCTSYGLMLVPRFICGIGISGSILNTPCFLLETSEPQIKSITATCLLLMVNIGIILTFSIGAIFTYNQMNLIMTVIPSIVAILILMYVPESPVCCLKKGDEEKAKEQLKWLRAIEDEEQLESTLNGLKESFLNTGEKIKTISMSDVFQDSYLTKSLVYGLIMQSSITLSGIGIFVTYQSIFIKEGLHLPESQHGGISVLLSSLSFTGAVCSLFIVHNLSRKLSFVIANLTVGLCFLFIAIFMYLDASDIYHVHWTVLLGLTCLYMYIQGCGITSTVYVTFPELFAVECRDKFSSILMFLHFSLHFSINKLYPVLVGYIHLYGWLFIFSSCSICISMFGIFFLPETKDKTIQQIVNKLSNKKIPDVTIIQDDKIKY